MLGQRHGLETCWDEDGNKTLTVKYNNGRELSRVQGPDEPGQQENIPGQQENIPDQQENIPDKQENIPDQQENIPDQQENIPDQRELFPEDDVKPPSEQHRVFRDISLKHRMLARCVGVENGVALLKDKNDRIKRVPIEKLSKSDQKWLRENFLEPQ